MKRVAIGTICSAVLLCLGLAIANAQPPAQGDSPGAATKAPIGRYQMDNSGDRVIVLDTATGSCWMWLGGKKWLDMGSPAESHESAEPVAVPSQTKLSDGRLQVTLYQRGTKELQLPAGPVTVRVGDVTGGQVMVSVHRRDGEIVLDDVSLESGEVTKFVVGGQPYFLRVNRLKNFLVGNDIVELEIALSRDRLSGKVTADSSPKQDDEQAPEEPADPREQPGDER
ncbi:MAG: hypothetical protein WDZ59_08130 [Pirellulales bacterium]